MQGYSQVIQGVEFWFGRDTAPSAPLDIETRIKARCHADHKAILADPAVGTCHISIEGEYSRF
jgi:hypothetical protein